MGAYGVARSVGVTVLQVPEEAGGAGAARGTSERGEEEVPAGERTGGSSRTRCIISNLKREYMPVEYSGIGPQI